MNKQQSLDTILSNHVSDSIGDRLAKTSTLSQVAQIVTNLEHFEVACSELERSLTSLRYVSTSSHIQSTHPRFFQLRPKRRHHPPHGRSLLCKHAHARPGAHQRAHHVQAGRLLRAIRVRLDAGRARGRAEHVPLRARQLAHDRRRLTGDQGDV